MDLRNIHTFIRVTELGSFTKAANELGYVQSAITMQIQQLEKELGFPLFDRIGKRISLTSLGNEFLHYAYEIMRAMQKAAHLGEEATDVHGTLRAGILESLLFANMLQLLPQFQKKYKNLQLQLKLGQTSELLQLLKQNQLDMVYLSAGLNNDPDLRCCYKRKEQMIFVCGPEHSAAKRRQMPVAELFAHDFIVTEHSGICYGRLQELAQRHSASFHTTMEVDSTVAIATLLQNNMALAFLPEYSVREQLEKGNLMRVDVDLEPQFYYSQILCHKSRWISPVMAALIDTITAAYPGTE